MKPHEVGSILHGLHAEMKSRYEKTSDTGTLVALSHQAYAAIVRFAPRDSTYPQSAASVFDIEPRSRHAQDYGVAQLHARTLIEMVWSLAQDFSMGRMRNIYAEERGFIFNDFLELAKLLLDEGAAGPCAVVAGTVLEEHVRRAAERHGIALASEDGRPHGFGRLVDELHVKGAITRREHADLRTWYGVRNDAAHAFDKVDTVRAARLIDDVRSFTARHET